MPVQTDTPIGVGSPNQWGLWGNAPDKVAAVQTSDGDTSVIYAFSKGAEKIQLYTFSPIVGVADPVTSASITARARQYEKGNATRHFFMYWNGAQAGSDFAVEIGSQDPTYFPGGVGYINCTYNAGAAALSAVNGQHGVYLSAVSGTGFEAWVTYVYRTVTFGFGGGAFSADTQFAHLIGSVAALIGGNLLLKEMPALNRALGNVKLRKDEYETAWKAWRNHKFPVWSF
jgi:hypothetical protein